MLRRVEWIKVQLLSKVRFYDTDYTVTSISIAKDDPNYVCVRFFETEDTEYFYLGTWEAEVIE